MLTRTVRDTGSMPPIDPPTLRDGTAVHLLAFEYETLAGSFSVMEIDVERCRYAPTGELRRAPRADDPGEPADVVYARQREGPHGG
jgi:hypothetical protein